MPTHDIAASRIAWAGASIGAVVVLVVVTVFLLLKAWNLPARTDRVREDQQPPVAGPPLQAAPQLDLRAYRAEKQRLLDGQARIDGASGPAPVAVSRAMALLAERAAAAASQPEAPR